MTQVVENKYGFKELKEKPSEEELKEYYSNKYFSKENTTNKYQKSYSEDEVKYFKNRLNRKLAIIENFDGKPFEEQSLLDIGCGEGWVLKFLKDKFHSVKGLEYSKGAASALNPDIADDIIDGDIFESIDQLIRDQKKYDLIILDNVLEHVIDPEGYINLTKELLHPKGTLIVEVPNDFSVLQDYLIENNKISKEFWVVPPDHISYFNYTGLQNIFSKNGWEVKHITCDFPIDINLLNENTNYVENKSKGRSVHLARVEFENLLDQISVDKTNDLFEKFASLGLGRNLIGYFSKK